MATEHDNAQDAGLGEQGSRLDAQDRRIEANAKAVSSLVKYMRELRNHFEPIYGLAEKVPEKWTSLVIKLRMIIKLGIVFPNAYDCVLTSLKKTKRLLVLEEVCAAGCIGTRILAACAENRLSLQCARLLNLGDGIIPHGTVSELRRDYGIDADAVVREAVQLFGRDMVET